MESLLTLPFKAVTITFSSWSIFTFLLLSTSAIYALFRYAILTAYSRLPETALPPAPNYDLPLDDSDPSAYQGSLINLAYPIDDLMHTFLSSIKIFGYLDRPVFHELARNLQTRKLVPGQILFDDAKQENRDFYVVVEGCIQVFIKGSPAQKSNDLLFDMDMPDHHWKDHVLLNEARSGATVSSLFSILSIFAEDIHVKESSSQRQPRFESVFPGLMKDEDIATPSSQQPSKISLDNDQKPLETLLLDSINRQLVSEPASILLSENDPLNESEFAKINENSNQDDTKTVGPIIPPDDFSGRLNNMNDSIRLPVDTINETSSKADSPFPRQHTTPLPQKSEFDSTAHPPHSPARANIVARALVDTTLLVIPSEAFRRLKDKFPSAGLCYFSSKAAGIVQVILSRFQKVTFHTLYKYLGLSRELLKIERLVNFAGADCLADRMARNDIKDSLDRLTERSCTVEVPIEIVSAAVVDDDDNHSTSDSQSPQFKSANASVSRDEHYEGDVDDSESDFSPRDDKANTHSPALTASPIAPSNEAWQPHFMMFEDACENGNVLMQHCYAIITDFIGFNIAPAPPVLNNTTSSANSSAHDIFFNLDPGQINSLLDGANLRRRGGAASQASNRNRRFSIDSNTTEDEIISTPGSAIAAPGPPVSNGEPYMDLEIRRVTSGDVLVYEGDRIDGLYFLISGSLEASMRPRLVDTCGSFVGGGGRSKKSLFLIVEGSMAGYLSAITGHPSFVTVRAKCDSHVAFLRKSVLDRYIERSPAILLSLAKRLVSQLSPVVLQIDSALEWGHVNAGQVLCRQGEEADAIYVVLSGRLRSILECDSDINASSGAAGDISSHSSTSPSLHRGKSGNLDGIGESLFPGQEGRNITANHFEILAEHGQNESVGELEVLIGATRPGTIHAIRDTEVAILPKILFEALSTQHPAITIQISKIIAAKIYPMRRNGHQSSSSSKKLPMSNPQHRIKAVLPSAPPSSSMASATLESAHNNANLKTICILPVHGGVPISEFADKLREALDFLGASVAVLNTATISQVMGKHAFTRLGRLKLMSWLNEMEDQHKLVLYVADAGVNSPWTLRCVRQADCILLVGIGDDDPAIGEYERLLIGMKTTARKELVFLHSERSCKPGSTATWLKNRGWIHGHHHIQMRLKNQSSFTDNKNKTINNLRSQFFNRYYTQTTSQRHSSSSSGIRSDFARLGRRLLSKSIGLVLGGGGARGIAHVGIIRALEEYGIPIDMVGGTSIGSFIGGLYARENDHVSIYGRAKSFSTRMSSLWRKILDITYPFTALFTGHEFNRSIWKIFLDTHIEDCWLSFFCVTTNITWSRMEIHRSGYMWRYIRASMSLSGYLPPLCDCGQMLLDGGYLNNLPADIMSTLGASTIIAIDVGSADETSDVDYGDSLSGWWVMLMRMNPLAGYIGPDVSKIPQMAEIQSKLAYVSCVKQLEEAKAVDGVLYLRPPVAKFGTLEFGKYEDIYLCGYLYGLDIIDQWEKDGTLESAFGLFKEDPESRKSRHSRRASI